MVCRSIPDFKTGVTGHQDLLSSDGDHANAAGGAVIVRNMLPAVEQLIAQSANRRQSLR